MLQTRAVDVLVPTYRCLGDPATAIALKREEVQMLRESGDASRLAAALSNLGWDLLAAGHVEAAAEAVDEAIVLLRRDGAELRGPELHTAGAVALLRGDLDRAGGYFTRALAAEHGDLQNLSYTMEGCALVAARAGALERALRLFAAAAVARDAISAQAEPGGRGCAPTRKRLPTGNCRRPGRRPRWPRVARCRPSRPPGTRSRTGCRPRRARRC